MPHRSTTIVTRLAMLVLAGAAAHPAVAQDPVAKPAAPQSAPATAADSVKAQNTTGGYLGAVPEKLVAQVERGLREYLGPDANFSSLANQDGLVGFYWGDASRPMPDVRFIFAEAYQRGDPLSWTLQEVIDLNFPGGSPEQFLAAVLPKEARLNLVYSPEATRALALPPLNAKQIRRASALTLMEKVSATSNPLSLSWTMNTHELPTLLISSSTPRKAPTASKEPAVVRIPAAGATSDSARREQEQFQDQIIKAIEEGLAMRNDPSPNFALKLNRPTGLIFVRGSPEEIELVRAIARAIMSPDGDGVAPRDATADPAAAAPTDPIVPAAAPAERERRRAMPGAPNGTPTTEP